MNQQLFIIQVEQMRRAQKLFFANIALAKESKLPADFAAAANALKLSKQLEAEVDKAIAHNLQPVTGN